MENIFKICGFNGSSRLKELKKDGF